MAHAPAFVRAVLIFLGDKMGSLNFLIDLKFLKGKAGFNLAFNL